MTVTTNEKVLQSLLAITADVIDDRLRAARERQSSTMAAFLLLSNAAGDGEERARDLARISAGALGLSMNLFERAGVKRWCVERDARIDCERVPAVAEAACTHTRTLGFSADPDRCVRLLYCLRSEQQSIKSRVRPALNRLLVGPEVSERFDVFIRCFATFRERGASEERDLFRHPPHTNAHCQPTLGKHVHCGKHLSGKYGMAVGEHEHGGEKANPARGCSD